MSHTDHVPLQAMNIELSRQESVSRLLGSLAEPGKTQHDPGHVEGRGAFAQGHKDPVTDSLSGYVSVSPHHIHTTSYLVYGMQS